MEGVTAFLFGMIFTASAVYQVTIVSLTPLQLVLVGTTLELAIFIFEIPTGIVADVYSRRTSIIIGTILIGLGFILEGSIPLFTTILIAQIIWGVGYTFTSGANQAWITDEIGESPAADIFLRARQVNQITALLGIGTGMLLGGYQVNLPIQVGGVLMVLLAGFLFIVMPEKGFKPISIDERNTWHKMFAKFKEGLRVVGQRPTLRTVLIIGLFYGLYSEGFDRLWTKHILDNFSLPGIFSQDPVIMIGSIRAIGMLLAVGGTELARRRVHTDNNNSIIRTLILITGLLLISLLIFARTNRLAMALIAFWLIYISRNVIWPLYTTWINLWVDSRVRATVHSMSGQIDAIGQILGGPIIGSVGSKFSVQAALTVSSLLLTPTLPLYLRTLLRRKNPEDVDCK